MADIEQVTLVVHGARAVILTIGSGLGLTVGFAATVPVHQPVGRLWAELGSWLSLALSLIWLAGVLGVIWTQAIAVTYLHTYRADKVTGRHFAGMGRLTQPAGRHRAVFA